MENKNSVAQFRIHFLELRTIINCWELIPGAPADEFDHLNHKILTHLYKNENMDTIARVVETELHSYYKLSTSEVNMLQIIPDIARWWESK